MAGVEISVVVCTYKRPDYLRKTIKSLVTQSLDGGRYEIIVVDNEISGETRGVVDEFGGYNVRYIPEPRLGASYARNTGWMNASGRYIAFTDDDAIAYPDWLESIIKAFDSVKPSPGVVGGKVEPIWQSKPPEWLRGWLLDLLTIVDHYDSPTVLNDTGKWLVAMNIAYPREILEKYGGWDVKTGRRGGRLLSCEEEWLNEKIAGDGHQIYYSPDIIMKHHIMPERMTVKWLARRMFWNGVSHAVIQLIKGGRRKGISSLIKDVDSHTLNYMEKEYESKVLLELKRDYDKTWGGNNIVKEGIDDLIVRYNDYGGRKSLISELRELNRKNECRGIRDLLERYDVSMIPLKTRVTYIYAVYKGLCEDYVGPGGLKKSEKERYYSLLYDRITFILYLSENIGYTLGMTGLVN
ncbi:MAG: glycosyltransferase family 2 protein [Candidatus Altiarchaeota archaeon]